MTKYKLIHKTTGEEHLCKKVTIGGFYYYIIESWTAGSNVKNILNFWIITRNDTVGNINSTDSASLLKGNKGLVIATTNPNIDAPKVIDEVEELANIEENAETHSYSEEDMIEFAEWTDTSQEAADFWRKNRVSIDMSGSHNELIKQKRKDLFQIWKSQQPKIIYYENSKTKNH